MILTEKFDFLQAAYKELYMTYFWIYEEDWNLIYSNCPHENEFKNFFLLSIDKYNTSILSDESFDQFYYSDSLNLSWMIIPDRTSDKLLYRILGPVFPSAISDNVLRSTMNTNGMDISSQIKFRKILESIPTIPPNTFQNLSDVAYFSIYNHAPKYTGNVLSESNTNKDEEKTSIPNATAGQGSYLFEQKMLSAVRTGDLTFNLQDYDGFYFMGNLSLDNPLRQTKNMIIVLTTLVTRAAIEGGMLPHMAYSLSDHYIQKIESCNKQAEVLQITNEMYNDFINNVHSILHESAYSSVVREAISLLKNNALLEHPMESIAKNLGYSTYYLTSQIKKETGKTYKEIVKDEKIFRAKLLLKSTNKDISSISAELNYISPSYFTSVFKKETGITPMEWRKNFNKT